MMRRLPSAEETTCMIKRCHSKILLLTYASQPFLGVCCNSGSRLSDESNVSRIEVRSSTLPHSARLPCLLVGKASIGPKP